MIPLRQALPGLLMWLIAAVSATAHDIPSAVTARMLARADADRFQLLVRVPLATMRDVEFPAQASGYLDIAKLAPQLPDLATVWIAQPVELYENGRRLPAARVTATQLSLPSDRSFARFDDALAHVRDPLPANAENLVWEQVFFDVLLEYPIQSPNSAFALRPGLEHLATAVTTSLEFTTPDGAIRPFEFHGDPGRVALDPGWSQAAWRFLKLGMRHIPDGMDHLLFLLCLVIPFRRLRALAWIVTGFTLAHSFSLFAAAMGLAPRALWFPALIEMLIAATIVYTALENIVATPSERRRALLAFGFGLIHGFGFAFAFRDSLQFAGPRLFTALFAFNLGVEIGQLIIIALLVPMLDLVFRFVVNERKGAIVLSALVAHSGWHWMDERAAALSRYDVAWSAFALRWMPAVALGAVLGWLASRAQQRAQRSPGLPLGSESPANKP